MKNNLFLWVQKNKWLAGALGLIAIFFCIHFALLVLGRNRGYAPPGNYPVHIRQGMTTGEIARMLAQKKLVRFPGAFSMEARMRGLAHKLQAGLYLIRGGMHNLDIVQTLSHGKVQMARLIVPEGFTVRDTGKALEKAGLGKADVFIRLAKDYAPYGYMQKKDSRVLNKAEGFIYPAVYDFPASYREKDLLELMVQTFNEELDKAGVLREVQDRRLDLREVITMASLVEKEAVFKEEQPRIAGIFYKRLEIGMPLQSDTTVQYILGGKQREIIYYKDTEISHPYNTYQNYGLPPGPIASPGMDAIKAVLHPEKTAYLYFVAERDGHHRFTTNYADHLRAIRDIENGR